MDEGSKAMSENKANNANEGNNSEVKLELTEAGIQQLMSVYVDEQKGLNQQMSLIEVVYAVRSNFSRIIISCAIFFGLGLLVVLLSPKLFTVTTQVVLERQDPTEAGVISNQGGSAFIATQAEILQSRSVISRALELASKGSQISIEDAMESLQASAVSGTQVVALSFMGDDPELGGQLLDSAVLAYRDKLKNDEQRIQEQRLVARETEFSLLSAEIEKQEQALSKLRSNYFDGRSGEDAIASIGQAVSDLSQQVLDVRQQRIALEKQLIAGSLNEYERDPTIRALREQFLAAQAELERVSKSLRSGHPSIVAAQREVELLRGQLAATEAANPRAQRRDIAAIKGIESELEGNLTIEQRRLADAETVRRQEQQLIDELEQTRTLTEERRRALLDQRLLAHLADSGEIGVTARVIADPVIPIAPTWPNIPLVLLVALMFGGIVGLLWAISLYRADSRQLA